METEAFSAIREARRLLRIAATGSLATLDADGGPFASLVNVATTSAGEPVLLISDLAVHTRNLGRDHRASLLLVAPDDDPASRGRYLARHREAAGYADFADFGFYRMTVTSAHLVAGFGRIVDLDRSDLLTDCSAAADLIAAEESAIEHMNTDHADALRLYATRLLGEDDGDWCLTGLDPDGLDLQAGSRRARLVFETPVTAPGALRHMLADLAGKARA